MYQVEPTRIESTCSIRGRTGSSFLKKGLNAAGVEAVLTTGSPIGNHNLISITRSEFLQVAVGIITDTPELIDHYLIPRPMLRRRPNSSLLSARRSWTPRLVCWRGSR